MRLICTLLFILLFDTISSQSISYNLGVGLPYSNNSPFFNGEKKLNKSTEVSLSIGFKSSLSKRDFTEIRISTFNSVLSGNLGENTIPFKNSIRKYFIEIQKYFLKFNLEKFGTFDFGVRFSYLLRSDVEGTTFNFSGNGDIMQINSQDFQRGRRFKLYFLAKYSLGSIKLNDKFKLRPTYTYALNSRVSNNISSIYIPRSSHIFELAFITDLSPKRKLSI